MQSSSAPFKVADIYFHTAATVPANLQYSVMVGGPGVFSRNTEDRQG